MAQQTVQGMTKAEYVDHHITGFLHHVERTRAAHGLKNTGKFARSGKKRPTTPKPQKTAVRT